MNSVFLQLITSDGYCVDGAYLVPASPEFSPESAKNLVVSALKPFDKTAKMAACQKFFGELLEQLAALPGLSIVLHSSEFEKTAPKQPPEVWGLQRFRLGSLSFDQYGSRSFPVGTEDSPTPCNLSWSQNLAWIRNESRWCYVSVEHNLALELEIEPRRNHDGSCSFIGLLQISPRRSAHLPELTHVELVAADDPATVAGELFAEPCQTLIKQLSQQYLQSKG